MKKSIFLFFAAILCAIGMNAATPEKLYLTPNSNWTQANARFAAYFFGNGETWVDMTKVAGEDNLYEVTTPAGYPSVIFCRMNPSATANNWDNKWNQTADLTIPTDGTNHYTVKENTWNSGGGNWSTYTPPTEPVIPDYYVAGNSAFVGANSWDDGNPAHDALKMVYSETNANWTLTVSNVAADAACEFKVNDGTWSKSWGYDKLSTIPEGVSNNTDGNICFTLSTAGDVTITFDGTNIQLTTTGAFKTFNTYDITVKAVVPEVWTSETISIHYWGDGVESPANPAPTVKEGNWNVYTITGVPEGKSVSVIFLNGTAWTSDKTQQTVDLTGITENICYQISAITKGDEGKCTAKGVDCEADITPEPAVPVVTYDYYVIGSINGWAPKDANFGMTDENADGVYEKEVTLAVGDNEIKVNNGTWDDGCHWGFGNLSAKYEGVEEGKDGEGKPNGNIKITLATQQTITVKFDKNTSKITLDGLTESTAPTKYYVKGSHNEWTADATSEMTLDGEVYKKEVTLAKDVEFKINDGASAWWGVNNLGGKVYKELEKGSDDNIKMKEEKTFTIIFNPAENLITFEDLTEETPVVEDFSNQPSVIYIKCDDWKVDNARFAAYFFGTEEKWVSMTDVDNDGIYEVVNDKKNKNVIFCRMNPANNENKWGENNSHVWNQSADLEIPTTTYLNYWTVTSTDDVWNKPTGKWMMLIGSGDNSEALAAADGQTVEDVYVNRSFDAGQLYTIALPFDLSDALTKTHFGNTVSVIKFVQLDKDENGDLVLLFENALGMGAGKPYVITPSNTIDGFTVNNVVINNTPNNVQQTTTGAQVTMEAVLSASKGATTNGRYWLASDTYLYNVSSALKSLRAVFNIQSNKANVRARVAFGENIETGVDNIITTDAPVKAIVNGQLIIIHDGVKYNVQGQKL